MLLMVSADARRHEFCGEKLLRPPGSISCVKTAWSPKISVADHIAEHLSHRNLPIKVNFYGVAAYGKPLWCHGNED